MNKTSASWIRCRSRQHLAEAYAGGPMKDRLRRWCILWVIARIRRGAHDRARVSEPCRGREASVGGCQCRAAASCTSSGPAHPRSVAVCTSVAQLEEPRYIHVTTDVLPTQVRVSRSPARAQNPPTSVTGTTRTGDGPPEAPKIMLQPAGPPECGELAHELRQRRPRRWPTSDSESVSALGR